MSSLNFKNAKEAENLKKQLKAEQTRLISDGAELRDFTLINHLLNCTNLYLEGEQDKKIRRKKGMKSTNKREKKMRPNPFGKADDIYLTKNKIAVTVTKSKTTVRGYTKTTQTKYYEQNESNIRLLKSAKIDTVRVGRTSNNYKRI